MILATAAYVLAGAYMVFLGRDEINPDGIAYIQLARDYAAGRLDLAVTTHWGPLLSWLLAPAAWLGANLVVAAKVLGVAFGLVAAAATADLTRQLNHGAGGRWAYVAMLALALTMIPDPVTPDMLLTALVACYFSLAIRAARDGGWKWALATGLVAGAAFLAKHYALPFVLAHSVVTLLVRWRMVRKGHAPGRIWRPVVITAAGAMLLVGPWIAVMSHHEGQFCLGTSSKRARAFSPTLDQSRLPLYLLQWPREGRITTWENPSEISQPWPYWSPLSGREGIAKQAEVIMYLAGKTGLCLLAVEPLHLLLAGLVVTILLAALGRRVQTPPDWWMTLWLLGGFAIFAGGYMTVYTEQRYLWPVYGVLVALAVRSFWVVIDLWAVRRAARGGGILSASIREDTRAGCPRDARAGRPRHLARATFGALLAASCLLSAIDTARDWQEQGAFYALVREFPARLHLTGPMASNRWRVGMFVAYWGDAQYLGRVYRVTAHGVADELTPFAPATVVVVDDPTLADELGGSGQFKPLGRERFNEHMLAAYRFAPAGGGP